MIKIFIVLLCLGVFASAQTREFPNTITRDPGTISPPATLEDMSWLAGYWRGEAFGGITEEFWSPPAGGSMVCAFRLINDDKVSFYEICTITEENNSLMLRLKHFNPDLKGWEEKDKTVDFPLVKVAGERIYFDGFTIENTGPDELNIYVILESKGKKSEMRFNYSRVD